MRSARALNRAFWDSTRALIAEDWRYTGASSGRVKSHAGAADGRPARAIFGPSCSFARAQKTEARRYAGSYAGRAKSHAGAAGGRATRALILDQTETARALVRYTSAYAGFRAEVLERKSVTGWYTGTGEVVRAVCERCSGAAAGAGR